MAKTQQTLPTVLQTYSENNMIWRFFNEVPFKFFKKIDKAQENETHKQILAKFVKKLKNYYIVFF